MGQPGFSGDLPGDGFNLTAPERVEQVAGEPHFGALMFGQPFGDQKCAAIVQSAAHGCAEPGGRRCCPVEQGSIEPGRADRPRLSIDGELRDQLGLHAAEPASLMRSGTVEKVVRETPAPIAEPLGRADTAEGFEPANMGTDTGIRIVLAPGLGTGDRQMPVGLIESALSGQRINRPVGGAGLASMLRTVTTPPAG